MTVEKSYKAEIVSIGSELLEGRTLNTNGTFLCKKLTEMGFSVVRETTLPDDSDLLKEGLSESLSCSHLVIATGGLGPTLDDISRKVAADLFDSPFKYDEKVAEALKARYGEAALPTLQDQATLPSKAMILPNTIGTAQGLIFNDGLRTLILLPGVPLEMQKMFEEEVEPFLKKNFRSLQKQIIEKIYFANMFEGELDPDLRSLQELESELSFGIYPSYGLLSLVIKSYDQKTTEMAANFLKKKFAKHLFLAPHGRIEEAVHELLSSLNLSLSIAESCTGGALSARLTSLPGASKYFLGSLVAYSNQLKNSFLNIPMSLIEEKGAVSSEVAEKMAEEILQMSGSDISLSVTGIAGPDGGTSDKPVGTVFFAVKEKGKLAHVRKMQAFGCRETIIEMSVNAVLASLYKMLRELKI